MKTFTQYVGETEEDAWTEALDEAEKNNGLVIAQIKRADNPRHKDLMINGMALTLEQVDAVSELLRSFEDEDGSIKEKHYQWLKANNAKLRDLLDRAYLMKINPQWEREYFDITGKHRFLVKDRQGYAWVGEEDAKEYDAEDILDEVNAPA